MEVGHSNVLQSIAMKMNVKSFFHYIIIEQSTLKKDFRFIVKHLMFFNAICKLNDKDLFKYKAFFYISMLKCFYLFYLYRAKLSELQSIYLYDMSVVFNISKGYHLVYILLVVIGILFTWQCYFNSESYAHHLFGLILIYNNLTCFEPFTMYNNEHIGDFLRKQAISMLNWAQIIPYAQSKFVFQTKI